MKTLFNAEVEAIGVNYGMLGDNLPPPSQVIALLKSRGVTGVRLFHPNLDALRALQGAGIQVILGTLNQDLQGLASNPSFATNWVQTNVIPFSQTVHFSCIATGNEVIPGELAEYVLPAMVNLKAALRSAGLGRIPVSTSVSTKIIGDSFPPSRGKFSPEVSSIMASITAFLAANGSPLLVNVYPYFAYISNPQQISLSYALFTSPEAVLVDGKLEYDNLFDAITDTVYSALEKAGSESVEIVVSESGWPSAGNGDIATVENAQTYNNNLIAHVSEECGTPKRPGKRMETYIFAVFNENLKPEGTEQRFGLFFPNMTEVYRVQFN